MAEPRVRDDRPSAQNSKRLNSWKEIADHFQRDIRTVQRWESKLGLPVHRRQHTRRGFIYAYESELDAWWADGRKQLEKTSDSPARRSWLPLAIAAAGVLLVAGASLEWKSFPSQARPLPFETTRSTRLTSTGRSNKAVISPDGRYIAHTQLAAGQEALLVRRMNTLHDLEVVPPGSFYYMGITFSPNSETIYYVTGTLGGAPSLLFRIPAEAGLRIS